MTVWRASLPVLVLAFVLPTGGVLAQADQAAAPAETAPAPAETAAPESAATRYEASVREAIAAQTAGDFERAHALFEQAHAIAPNARTLRGMGVASFQARHYTRAQRELNSSLTHPEKPLDAELRATVDQLLQRIQAELGVLALQVVPATAMVSVDDTAPEAVTEPLILDPGPHSLRVSADGFFTQTIGIDVTRGTRETMRLELAAMRENEPVAALPITPVAPRVDSTPASTEPNRAHRQRVIAIWTSGAFAAAAAISAGGVYLGAQHRIDEIAKLCKRTDTGTCTPEERDRQAARAHLKRFERGLNASLGIAAGSLLATSALLSWDYFANSRHIDLWLTGDSIQLQGRF